MATLLESLRRFSQQRQLLNARLSGRVEPERDWFGEAADCIADLEARLESESKARNEAERLLKVNAEAFQRQGDDLLARAEAAERDRDAARIELNRIHANALPGGWTEELNNQIQARHTAEDRAKAAERDAAVGRYVRKQLEANPQHVVDSFVMTATKLRAIDGALSAEHKG